MKTSESITTIAGALCKFQAKINNPKNTEKNEFFKSKYAPLSEIINHVKPVMAENGLSFTQSVTGDGESVSMTTLLLHESGEWIESDVLKIKNQENRGVSMAQAVGISITYGRRYQLSALLGISSEDDTDGNNPQNGKPAATQKKPETVKHEPKKPKEKTFLEMAQGYAAYFKKNDALNVYLKVLEDFGVKSATKIVDPAKQKQLLDTLKKCWKEVEEAKAS